MTLEKIVTNKVWADEIFYSNESIDVTFTPPEGIVLTPASTIEGTATVAVLSAELDPAISDPVTANVTFMIQEDLTVYVDPSDPEAPTFDLEYTFQFDDVYEYQKFELPAGLTIADLALRVFRFVGTVTLENVDLVAGTFTNVADTETKLKVAQEIQTFVVLGSAPYVQTSDIIVIPAP